jgi:hypothetical protein
VAAEQCLRVRQHIGRDAVELLAGPRCSGSSRSCHAAERRRAISNSSSWTTSRPEPSTSVTCMSGLRPLSEAPDAQRVTKSLTVE